MVLFPPVKWEVIHNNSFTYYISYTDLNAALSKDIEFTEGCKNESGYYEEFQVINPKIYWIWLVPQILIFTLLYYLIINSNLTRKYRLNLRNIDLARNKTSTNVLIAIVLLIVSLVPFIYLLKYFATKDIIYSNKTMDNISLNNGQSFREKSDTDEKMSDKVKEERKTKKYSLYDKYEKICNSSRNSERTLDRLSSVGFSFEQP